MYRLLERGREGLVKHWVPPVDVTLPRHVHGKTTWSWECQLMTLLTGWPSLLQVIFIVT